MKRVKILVLAILCICVSLFTGCAKLPNDGANPKMAHFENLNKVRYIEIFVVGGNGLTGRMEAAVYNTSASSWFDAASMKDSAPQAWVESLSTDEIKKRFGALGASINGPKLWMLDTIDIPLGAEEDFNGKKIPWVAVLHLSKEQLKTLGKFSYATMQIERKSQFSYKKGTTVFLIDDANGNTWVMKGFELGLKPRWTFEEFAADPASKFKQLPAGWKFRTKVLDQDLIMIPASGIATIMPDEFFNVYDKTGPGFSNYKP
jgi:hypothetical protein